MKKLSLVFIITVLLTLTETLIVVTTTVIILSCLFGLIGEQDRKIAIAMHEHHCSMVKLHKIDPSIGWPDYDDRCSDD